jgi:hypothetical protein
VFGSAVREVVSGTGWVIPWLSHGVHVGGVVVGV